VVPGKCIGVLVCLCLYVGIWRVGVPRLKSFIPSFLLLTQHSLLSYPILSYPILSY
jgi:hypothetical protein